MKAKRNYFILGLGSALLIVLFINATDISTKLFLPFQFKSGKQYNSGVISQQFHAPKLPKSIQFAGEDVPLEDYESRERFDRELVVNSYLHSSTIFLIKKANRFFPIIEKILEEEGVPDDFKYLCMAESGLDNVVSPSGAAGFWQFMKGTAPSYGLYISGEVDERYNLEKATRAACKYLKEAKANTGTWTAAAAAYNMGNAGVLNQMNKQLDSNYYNLFLNTETSRYVFRIIAIKTIYENQKEYGFYLDKEDLYPPYETKEITISGSQDWVVFAKNNGTTYKDVRKLNPWIREPKLYNKENRTYSVKIPL